MGSEDIIRQLAERKLLIEHLHDIGAVAEADYKAEGAEISARLAELDKQHGTADVTYGQFRDAFDAGADCDALWRLRNAMNPKSTLKIAASADLNSVGCHTPSDHRRSTS